MKKIIIKTVLATSAIYLLTACDSSTSNKNSSLTVPLGKQLGFEIKNSSAVCGREMVHIKDSSFHVSGSFCMNDNCTIKVNFKEGAPIEDIPKEIEIPIRKDNSCPMTKFKVPKNLSVMRYYVNMHLSKEQKEKIGAVDGKSIKLKNSNGYSITPEYAYFYYSNIVSGDEIIQDGISLGHVSFTVK